MKTIKNLLVLLAVLASFSVFGQRQQVVLPPDVEAVQVDPIFQVELIVNHCYIKGKSVAAKIHQTPTRFKPAYRFTWYVDNEMVGNRDKIDCVLGRVATVYVTQFPSGKTIVKQAILRNPPIDRIKPKKEKVHAERH